MKIRIRSKILITICSLILVSLAGQIIFNLFFSKAFFLHKQKSIISDAYEQIKEQYDTDLTDVNILAEYLLDTYNIKTILSDGDEIVYFSGYPFFGKGPWNPQYKPFRNNTFTTNPRVDFIEGLNVSGDMERLQLSGKFYHNDQEVFVLLTLQIASIDNSVSVFTESNIYISLAVLFIGVLVALLVSKNITAPITAIEAVSKKIAVLDFSYAADENAPTAEIASLAKSINQMSEQLDKNMRELNFVNQELQKDIDYRMQIESYRREFIASVSHEMKTPLSLLQIYAENLKNNVQGIDKDYYCDTILEETDKLNQMVSEMLEISSIDSGFIEMDFEKLNLSEFCLEMLYQYKVILENYQTEIRIEDGIFVTGDPKYLERVVKNILNNAIQHTEKK